MRCLYRAPLVVAIAALAFGSARGEAADAELLLATTTSVRDSGLLDALLPVFRERSGVRVRSVAVGTGAALRMAADGNADVLITHAAEAEEKLVSAGAVVARRPFMENHFVIAGPPEDPAGVAQAATAAEAFRRIVAAGSPYVSRADDSGTHQREVALLRAAGLEPGGAEAFVRSGSGMGLALQIAGERRAYTLSDVGTFLAFRERTGLVALSRPTADLRNVYAVLRVNPERFPGRIRAEAARSFEAFLVDPATQRRIASFGVERYGRPLFRPLLLGPAGEARRE